jgi:ATP-dependent RNA helicase SUPV3L1/SUV3
MSMVGCSGEEFASILKALGFRRERRKLTPEPLAAAEAAAAPPEGEPAKSEAVETAPPETEAFEEIWRPGKRKDAHHAKRGKDQRAREARPQGGKRERHRPQAQPKRERPVCVEHSPFAALKELRQTLVARRQERS